MTDSTPQYAAPQPAAPLSEADDKLWASLAHFGNILSFVPALIIYLVLKDRGPKVAVEGKEALNWGINVAGAFIILQILSGIMTFVFYPLSLLIGLLIFALVVVNLIFAIMGGVKVQGGGSYRYPINIRWIK